MDILQERAQVVQQVIDLTVGRDTGQIAENIAEIKRYLQKIQEKQPAGGISVRRYENRFFHSPKK